MDEQLIERLNEKFPYRNWRMWMEWYETDDKRLSIASRMAIEREMSR